MSPNTSALPVTTSRNNSKLNTLDQKVALKTQFKQDLVSLQHRLDTNRSIQTPTTTVTADN